MQIASVTGRRYMPPWLPEKGYGDFKDERRLTDAQIRLISAGRRMARRKGSRRKRLRSRISPKAGRWGPLT